MPVSIKNYMYTKWRKCTYSPAKVDSAIYTSLFTVQVETKKHTAHFFYQYWFELKPAKARIAAAAQIILSYSLNGANGLHLDRPWCRFHGSLVCPTDMHSAGRSGLVVSRVRVPCERTQVRISPRTVVYIATATAICSFGHRLRPYCSA